MGYGRIGVKKVGYQKLGVGYGRLGVTKCRISEIGVKKVDIIN